MHVHAHAHSQVVHTCVVSRHTRTCTRVHAHVHAHAHVQVHYVLDQPPEGWTGGSGYLSAEMLAERLPPPSLGGLAKVSK